MSLNWNDLIGLWTRPLPEGEAAVAAFRKVYTDPVWVNGTPMAVAALVDRARATQRTFADLKAVLMTQIDTSSHSTIVFRIRGRHVGPLATPLGEIAATGKMVDRQI